MARKSVEQMKKDELKIIQSLKQNARGSIEIISKKYKFSRQKVWRIIKRLEKSKKIWGYYTVTDDEKLNQKRFVILIKRSTEPVDDSIQKIMDFTMTDHTKDLNVDIECSSYLHGHYDWLFIIAVEDMKDVKRFTHLLSKEYQLWINEILVLQDIFPLKKYGIFNPNIKKIEELF
ncbi:MAG: Lrp/AsnC family transcriptional regulator [Candidatus Thermoplasmatota archaeon]|nr:Lrp/AsnC family transcriptional regulator [Candidatus Thermoplasmatota archaeon]